jgi:hypothetical protein
MANVWSGVTIDCLDPERVARFWSALLGREAGPSQEGWVHLGKRSDPQPRLVFQPVSEPAIGKVRIHLDVSVDDIDEAVATMIGLGGRTTGERHDYDAGVVVVMTDPENPRVLPGSVLRLRRQLAGRLEAHQGGRAIHSAGTLAAVSRVDEDVVLNYWSADCRQLVAKIERDLLERQLQHLLDAPFHVPIKLAGQLDITAGLGHSWAALLRLMAGEFSNESAMLDHPLIVGHLHEALTIGLLMATDHPYREALTRPGGAYRPPPVRRRSRPSRHIPSTRSPSPRWPRPPVSPCAPCRQDSSATSAAPRWRTCAPSS